MSAFDERTPLLTSNLLAAERRVEKRNQLRPPQKQKATKTQIGLLMFWRGCHPLFFAFCMPTLTRFIIENGIGDEKTVGFYASWIGVAYSVALILGLYPSLLLSDTIGRKPTILLGIVLSGLATASFGFCQTFAQMTGVRFFVGLATSLTPATLLTMHIEISTKETQARHFVLNSLGWQVGSVVAPFFGAMLARPADHWSVLRGTLLDRYPYALPSLVVGLIPVLSVLPGLAVIKETLPKNKRRTWWSAYSSVKRKMSLTRERPRIAGPLFIWPVTYAFILWALAVFTTNAATITEIMAFSTPRKYGGFGLKATHTAAIFGLRSVMITLFEVTFYSKLALRYGPERLSKVFAWAFPLVYGLYFILSTLISHGLDQNRVFAAVMIINPCFSVTSVIFISVNQLLPSRMNSRVHLARVNTWSEIVANAAHGTGVFIASNLWAGAIEYNWIGGRASWVFLLACSFLLCLGTSFLTHIPGWREAEEEEGGGASAVTVYTAITERERRMSSADRSRDRLLSPGRNRLALPSPLSPERGREAFLSP